MNKVLRELADGDRVTIRVLLSSKNRGVTAKGAPYLSFVLQDKVFNFQGTVSLPLFATAYLVYHTQFRLSRGF